jgi:hypothetical protein
MAQINDRNKAAFRRNEIRTQERAQFLRFIGPALDAEAVRVNHTTANGTKHSRRYDVSCVSRKSPVLEVREAAKRDDVRRVELRGMAGDDDIKLTIEVMETCKAALNAASLAPASCTTSHRNVA